VSGDPWVDFTNFQEDLSYWDFAYFAIVTMSTVGYGDIGCKTVLGRIFIIIFIFGALVSILTLLSHFLMLHLMLKLYLLVC